VEALEPQLGDRLDGVEFAVEDIPPAAVTSALAAGDPVPLASAFPAADPVPARVVVYRRPVQLRGGPEVADLVAVVLVEQLAALLGIPPEEIDPDLGD
jgi:predicted Zn-dependent protease with MMP-like domain